MVGLYGVLAYTVRQRTQEIGLRLALLLAATGLLAAWLPARRAARVDSIAALRSK